MFVKELIREPQPQGPDHLVARQSERSLYRLAGIGVLSILVYIFFFYRGAVVFPQRQALNGFGSLVQGIIGVGCVVMMTILFAVFINYIINYFYTIYLIGSKRVTKITYGTNFKSKVVTVDLDQVMYVNTDQSGVMQSTFDYGDIHLHLASDEELILENIPQPKQCVMDIEELKDFSGGGSEFSSQENTSSKNDNKKSSSKKENDTDSSSNKRGTSSTSQSELIPKQRKQIKKELRNEIKEELKDELRNEITLKVTQEIITKLEE